LPVAVWWVFSWVRRRSHLSLKGWLLASWVIMAGFFLYRLQERPEKFMDMLPMQVTLSADEWSAFAYLRENAPPDSVILSNHYLNSTIVGGLSARASYEDYSGNTVDMLATKLDGVNRPERIKQLWGANDPATFCSLLTPTPVTYLMEHAADRLHVGDPGRTACLAWAWSSPKHEVTIWRVRR